MHLRSKFFLCFFQLWIDAVPNWQYLFASKLNSPLIQVWRTRCSI
jgi:hypothetical protein